MVLNAIRDENPSLRYLAGNDVEKWLGGKKKTADEEMYKTMRQNLILWNIKRRKETFSIMLYITACKHRKSKHDPIFVYILKFERINQIYQESRDL